MQQLFTILSNTLSVLLYPLLIPTYGMVLYMVAMYARLPEFPLVYVGVGIVGTLVLTCLIPVFLIWILWKRGIISSLHIENAEERTTPYIYTIVCFGFWCYFVAVSIHLPLVWTCVAIGATVALMLVTIINHWWKISAHLTSMGGLLGGVCSMGLYYRVLPIVLICVILLLSLLLMYARIYLKAHTSMQVICGYILGILCTFIPNLLIYHA